MPTIECRTCTERDGAVHLCHHVVTKFTVDGNPLPEPIDQCAHCEAPASTAEMNLSLPEQKLWLMQDVEPNEYETGKDGVKRMKDWAQGELEARIGAPDNDEIESEQEARERKRAQAREVRATHGSQLAPDLAARIVEKVNEGALIADAQDAGLSVVVKRQREVEIVRP